MFPLKYKLIKIVCDTFSTCLSFSDYIICDFYSYVFNK